MDTVVYRTATVVHSTDPIVRPIARAEVAQGQTGFLSDMVMVGCRGWGNCADCR